MEPRKQLVLEVPEYLHKDVKIRAANLNISMKVWLLQAIFEKIAQERMYESKKVEV